MQVKNKIDGVGTFEVPPEQTLWARRALAAAARCLNWASLSIALEALDSGSSGSDDGYNLSACAYAEFAPYEPGATTYGKIAWVIKGGCGYGSRIEVRANEFHVQSCGGHWVAGKWALYGNVEWDCDTMSSTASWGDTPNGEPVDKEARLKSLRKAFRSVREEERS